MNDLYKKEGGGCKNCTNEGPDKLVAKTTLIDCFSKIRNLPKVIHVNLYLIDSISSNNYYFYVEVLTG